jgi:DNA primase
MVADGVVEEIKSRLDIVEVISEYLHLKRAGQNYKGLCPFHAEKTPSFMVSHPKQIFHCFGCAAGGDVFAFVMKHEGLEFAEALDLLARKAGVELRPRRPGERSAREVARALQREALGFFRQGLLRAREAREYLAKRGISAESVEAFSLGYAPPGWHALQEHLRKKGYTDEQMMAAGLSARGSRGPYDIFRSRLMFPIMDMHGEPVAFGGRVLDDSTPKYLNSPDTPLFKKSDTLYALDRAREAVRQAGEALVVEGYLDVIMCHQGGFRHAVAPLGTALTEGHVRKLARLAERLLLVFDGDQAGLNAARRSLLLVMEGGLRARVLVLPAGEDPHSVLLKDGAGALEALMREAVSPVEFLLGTAPGEKLQAVRAAVSLISRVSDAIVRDEMVRELSERSGTREVAIREELGRVRTGGRTTPPARREDCVLPGEERLLLSVALHEPERAAEILKKVAAEDMRDPLVRRIFGRLADGAGQGGGDASPLEMAEGEEERALLRHLAVSPGFEPDSVETIVEDCVRAIARRAVEQRIQRARAGGDLKLLSKLLSERHKLMPGA